MLTLRPFFVLGPLYQCRWSSVCHKLSEFCWCLRICQSRIQSYSYNWSYTTLWLFLSICIIEYFSYYLLCQQHERRTIVSIAMLYLFFVLKLYIVYICLVILYIMHWFTFFKIKNIFILVDWCGTIVVLVCVYSVNFNTKTCTKWGMNNHLFYNIYSKHLRTENVHYPL